MKPRRSLFTGYILHRLAHTSADQHHGDDDGEEEEEFDDEGEEEEQEDETIHKIKKASPDNSAVS